MSRFRVLWIVVGLSLAGLVAAVAWLSVGGLRIHRPASELYARLKAHESVEQTKDYLAKVQSRLNSLPWKDDQPDNAEMTMLSAAVYRRAIDYPELPEVWIAAAAVINRRSQQSAKTTTPSCGYDSGATPPTGSSHRLKPMAFTVYQDCAISLDGDGRAITNPMIDVLELKDVHVTYRGGPFPPISTLTCVQCSFDLQVQGIPPPRGKSFIRGLLMTYSENFAIEISNDGAG
jgi:hypothetical protein